MSIRNLNGLYMLHIGPCTQDSGPFRQIFSFNNLLQYTSHYPLHMNMPFTLHLEYFANNKMADKHKILVGNKLIYPEDVKLFLINQYNSTLDFTADEDRPIMLDSIPKYSSVLWHYLTDADIFLERETLGQLWKKDENLGKVPSWLREFCDRVHG